MKNKATKKATRQKADVDNPALTARAFKTAKRFDQLPKRMQEGLQAIAKRGRPPKETTKKLISFRMDADLVAHLKKSRGYNTRVETMLLKAWEEQRL